ncbi:MAG: hypothetical protein V4701_05310 [Pseudomonadota bacterium]
MTRTALFAALTLALSACATAPTGGPGGSDPAAYVLADKQPSDAPALARASAARGDTRLIGFIGFALVFPGSDRQTADRLGYRVIDAGGDAFRNEAERLRADRAYRFAEAWNQTIVSIVD